MALEESTGGGGGGGSTGGGDSSLPTWAPPDTGTSSVTVFGGGTQQAWAAAQEAFNQAYLQDYLRYQDRWHAQEIAEQVAMRKLQESIALGYIRGQPTLERQLGEGNLGLGYLQLLASLRGPSDWLRYWSTVRAAEPTSLPTWAASLAQGLTLPAYQAPTMEPLAVGQVWGATGQPSTGQGEAARMPTILPQHITAAQWRNLLPSEQAGLQGLVEAQGGWWPDFAQQMMASWPTGTAGRRTTWV